MSAELTHGKMKRLEQKPSSMTWLHYVITSYLSEPCWLPDPTLSFVLSKEVTEKIKEDLGAKSGMRCRGLGHAGWRCAG